MLEKLRSKIQDFFSIKCKYFFINKLKAIELIT